jgi:hypothetical protein
MMIHADNCGFEEDGSSVTFDLVVGRFNDYTSSSSVFYTNTYFCKADQLEWRLTGCTGAESDSCPSCGQPTIPFKGEVDQPARQ